MDQIKEMMNSLSELSDDQVGELQGAIINEFEAVEGQAPTPETVEAMTSLADMLDTVRTEVKRREAAAEELAQQAAEAASRVHGGDMTDNMPEEQMEEPEPEPAPAAPAESEDDDEELGVGSKKKSATYASHDEESTVAENTIELSSDEEASTEAVTEELAELSTTTQDAPEAQEENPEAPVTAAATPEVVPDPEIEAPADRRPTSRTTAVPVAITAGADIPGFTAGSPMDDMSTVADAFSKRLHALRRVNGGDGEQHIVASIAIDYPEERQLTSGDAENNWNKIQNVVGPQALVASGGYNAPLETRYDIFGIGTADRPVRDCLARFQADRGGIRYIQPPVLSSYLNAVGVWQEGVSSTNLYNAYPSVTSGGTPGTNGIVKQKLQVAAATETTAVADAVTLQLQFGNLATRAYPELIARHNELGLIQHAREAESTLLSKIGSASTAVTTSNVIGVARDFVVQVDRTASNYRNRHRMAGDAPLRVIAPIWVKDAMRADIALQMPGDGLDTLALADSKIESFFSARNINVCWHLDASLVAPTGSAAFPEFPDTFVWYLYAEGSFLFLDGGTLDLGIIRDSTLVGTNDYIMFVETFEGVALVGVESLAVTSTIKVNGAAAALVNTYYQVGVSSVTTLASAIAASGDVSEL